MVDPQTAIIISVAHSTPASKYHESVGYLQSAQLPVLVEQRDIAVFASLQYFMDTAIVVYVFKAYADKFLNKLAEDNYEFCKAALKSLWSKCLSTEREAKVYFISTEGKVGEAELLRDLSFVAKTEDGQSFRLLFPDAITEQEFQNAVRAFYCLLEKHDQNPTDSVVNSSTAIQQGAHHQRILTWLGFPGRLVEVDALQSAQQHVLVTVELHS